MKYMNLELACALVTSLIISLVMHYFNRDKKEGITIKTHLKTFIVNSLIIVVLLYLKKKVLDSMFPGSSVSVENITDTGTPEYNDIIVGTPNF